jgi:hypothetical protein
LFDYFSGIPLQVKCVVWVNCLYIALQVKCAVLVNPLYIAGMLIDFSSVVRHAHAHNNVKNVTVLLHKKSYIARNHPSMTGGRFV